MNTTALIRPERDAAPATPTARPCGAAFALLPARAPGKASVADFMLASLDSLAYGMALLDEESRLFHASTAARSVLAQAGWTITPGDPGTVIAPDTTPWLLALRKVCRDGLRQLLELPTAGGPRYATLLPVTLAGEHRAFAVFGRAELCGGVELQMFSSRHGLTGAESQVMRLLARGMPPASIAERQGVARSTVLTHVAAIRSKTQRSSMRQLLDTLCRMPPLRPVVMCSDQEH